MPRALIIRLTISLFFLHMVIRIKNQNTSSEDRFSIPESQEKIDLEGIFFLYSKGMEDLEIDIPKFVKTARTKLGMTQLELADFMGCTKGNINSWEKGRHEPSYSQIIKLSRKSGVPMPHDQSNEFMRTFEINIEELDVDQIEIIKATTKVPKESRPQVRKIVGTFTDPGEKKIINGNGNSK